MWVRVELSYATFGLRIEEGRVVEAPPIARWALGRTERQVADYYRHKGARFERLTLGDRSSGPDDPAPRSRSG